MKYIANLILLMCLTGVMLCACNDIRFGDDFLGRVPEASGAITDSMFNSKVNADKVLNHAYRCLPYGIPISKNQPNDKLGVNVLEALSDLHYSFRNNIMDGPTTLYYNGALSSTLGTNSAGREAYRFGSELDYEAIRYAWIYIENAGKIPDMTDEERRERVAEAKMIVALSYAQMLRYVGGVPLLDHYVKPNEDMHYERATFAQTVDYIIRLLDEAKNDLLWKQPVVDDGRMTKAGALGLKLRVLLFAASPTFNSEYLWHPAANEYTCYMNYDRERWKRAVDAGDEFLAEYRAHGEYDLTRATDESHASRRKAFQQAYYDRGGTETLISIRKAPDSESKPYDDVTYLYQNFFAERNFSGPTLNYVNMFSWDDGENFPEDYDWSAPSAKPFWDESGAPVRDPRLYETVVVPGSRFYDGSTAPVYTNHKNYKPETTGFLMMKFIMEENADRKNRPTQWPYLRLPEVWLSYAEALNEYNGAPTKEAFDFLNDVRTRAVTNGYDVDLGMSKETFRDLLLKERALEFGFEEVRWFDLVRWGMKDDFTKPLYGLSSTALYDANGLAKFFSYKVYQLNDRTWKGNWDTKWYLSPIPYEEISKEYGMTQNPGW